MRVWIESVPCRVLGAAVTLFEFFIVFVLPPMALLALPVFLGYVVFRLIKPKVAQADGRDHEDPQV